MARTAVATLDNAVPTPIVETGQAYGLTAPETERIVVLMRDHQTNLPAIRSMLETGLSILEVEQVLDTRTRVQAELEGQSVSLKQIIRFQEDFPSMPLQSDVLVQTLLNIHDRFQTNYLDQMLKQLMVLHARHPDALPETLADILAGESDLDFNQAEE
ncbi:MAG: hypothetical protein V4682_01550 [Patescibacteria group bacterium]